MRCTLCREQFGVRCIDDEQTIIDWLRRRPPPGRLVVITSGDLVGQRHEETPVSGCPAHRDPRQCYIEGPAQKIAFVEIIGRQHSGQPSPDVGA